MQAEQTLFSTDTLWTIAVIVLILAVLKSLVLPRIASALDRRARAIEEDVKHARAAREASIDAAAAEIKGADYKADIEATQADVQQMIDESRERLQQQHEEKMAACKEDIAAADAAFHKEAEAMRQKAMQDIRNEAAAGSDDTGIHLEQSDKQQAGKTIDEAMSRLNAGEDNTRKH